MIRILYSLVFYLAIPLVLLRVYWRSRKEPRYKKDLRQRFGFCPRLVGDNWVWVHAVSAGESIAAVPLIKELLAAGRQVVVTSMTPTGREQIERLLGNQVTSCYAPYDMPDVVMRFLRRSRPQALVIIDTELWPNMLHYAHRQGIKILLVNARLSARSAAGYGRIKAVSQAMLQAIDVVAAQSQEQGDRFVELGLVPERLQVTGSIKFDASQPSNLAQRAAEFRRILGRRLIIVAGSTHPGEEQMLLDAVRPLMQSQPDILLVLAPRHHYRAEQVERLCQTMGLVTVRRSANLNCSPQTQVYLLDTMGELGYLYPIADITFVGGSLVPVGGHNPMEPASHGKPVIMGQHLRNIQDIADRFIANGGLLRVESSTALASSLASLCQSAAQRQRLGAAALQTMAENRGALKLTLRLIDGQLGA